MSYQQRLYAYEAEKEVFRTMNPQATPDQYEKAMLALAQKYGI